MITTKQETAIRDTLATMPTLAVGLGTKEQACSIAAINLAMTGTLTDTVPECMSLVIGRWIISVQDQMPATIRDSAAWRELLVLSAGTGQEHESERVVLMLEWMWSALALVQPLADVMGYGVAWATMLSERTTAAATSAATSASTYAYAAASKSAATSASASASKSAYAAAAASAATSAATYAYAAASAATDAAAATSAAAAAYAAAWTTIDPVGLLRRLVAVTDARAVQPTTGDAHE